TDGLDRMARIRFWQRQWLDRKQLFRGQSKARATGRKNEQFRAIGQEVRDEPGGPFPKMLAIVKHKQHPTLQEDLTEGRIARVGLPDHSENGARYQQRLGNRGQLDPGNPIREYVSELG